MSRRLGLGPSVLAPRSLSMEGKSIVHTAHPPSHPPNKQTNQKTGSVGWLGWLSSSHQRSSSSSMASGCLSACLCYCDRGDARRSSFIHSFTYFPPMCLAGRQAYRQSGRWVGGLLAFLSLSIFRPLLLGAHACVLPSLSFVCLSGWLASSFAYSFAVWWCCGCCIGSCPCSYPGLFVLVWCWCWCVVVAAAAVRCIYRV
jgi:hypothetical protein